MRSKTSAGLLLLGIFLLGGIAGAASLYIYRNLIAPNQPQRPRVTSRHDIIEEMAQSLKLDPQQKNQLRTIWQQSRDQYNNLSLAFRPQYEKIRTETNDAIRTILRPDQRQQFDDTLKKMDSRHSSHSHDNQPPGPPGLPGK